MVERQAPCGLADRGLKERAGCVAPATHDAVVVRRLIFEERYRQLVGDLLDGAEPRRFGVIAIRKGRETGIDGVRSLYEIGCTATVRRVDRHEDGRFNIVTVGTQRFRLLGLDQDAAVPAGRGRAAQRGAPADPAAAGPAVRLIQAAFREYLDALTEWGGATVRIEELPDEPELLSLSSPPP